MIGCAWTTPPEKRLFKMFGEVLHIDCTADTNYEDRPFLTITGRDSNGKMFTVIRAFLPNERAWVFRWLFQTVMPSLLECSFAFVCILQKHLQKQKQSVFPLKEYSFASISNDVDETELDKKPPAKKLKDAKGNSISDWISASFFIHGTDIGDV